MTREERPRPVRDEIWTTLSPILRIGIPITVIFGLLIAFSMYRLKQQSLESKFSPTPSTLPEPSPTSLPLSTASLEPTNTTEPPTLNSVNCTTIKPGETTWGAAQRIGNPNTIWDFDSYQVTKDGQQIGNIKPRTWNVKTATDEQRKLRADNRGATVCAIKN